MCHCCRYNEPEDPLKRYFCNFQDLSIHPDEPEPERPPLGSVNHAFVLVPRWIYCMKIFDSLEIEVLQRVICRIAGTRSINNEESKYSEGNGAIITCMYPKASRQRS